MLVSVQKKLMATPLTATIETYRRDYIRHWGQKNFAFQICSGVLAGEVQQHPLAMLLRQLLRAMRTVSLRFADLRRDSLVGLAQEEAAAR